MSGEAAAALPLVAASEHDLIMMARALVQPHAHDTQAYLAGKRALPASIGPTCAALLGDALARLWPALWRRDRARPGASLTVTGVARGRGWERHAPATLHFTAATLALLRWLVATPLGGDDAVPELAAAPLAPGDEVAIYLALALAEDGAQRAIARQPLVRGSALAWLGFAHRMAGPAPAFDALAVGVGAIVVEALGRELAERWRTVELAKRAIADPEQLLAIGRAQTAALDGFMTACDAAGRRDLAGFVLDAAAPVLARDVSPVPPALEPTASLSARSSARIAAGALLRGVRRWSAWDDAHRGVRFIDDGYDAAQLLLARFEAIGRAGADRAAQWLAELASLAPQPPAGPASATIEAP